MNLDANTEAISDIEVDKREDPILVIRDTFPSALFTAITLKNVSLVDDLLRKGEKMHEAEEAPILAAIRSGSIPMVRYFCEQTTISDKIAKDAIERCVESLNLPMLRLLLTMGFKVEHDFIAENLIEAIETENAFLLNVFVYEDSFERWLDSPKFMLCLIGMMQSTNESILAVAKALHTEWGLPWIDVDEVLTHKLNNKINSLFSYLNLSGSGPKHEARVSIYERYLIKASMPKILDDFVESIKDAYFTAIAKVRALKGGSFVAPQLFQFNPKYAPILQNTESVHATSIVSADSDDNVLEPEVDCVFSQKKQHLGIS